jgi:signal peptidase I
MHPIADTVTGRPRAVDFGIAVALVLAGLYLVAIPWSPLNIIFCAVFVAIMLGLRNRNAWSGYGGALFFSAGWVGGPVAMERFGAAGTAWVSVVLATFPWGWIALATVTLLAPQVFRACVIPTGAMEDTLLIGDQLLVRVLGISAPSRGGIVVFRYPVDIRQTFVKRCMGVPGKKLDGAYACHKTDYIEPYRDNFPSEPNRHLFTRGQDMLDHHVVKGEVVVPPENYFVMGDNRDSCRAQISSARRGSFMGPMTRLPMFWPVPTPGSIRSPVGTSISRTRWRRVLMPVRGYAVN